MKTKSIKETSPEEIQTSLQESMADGFKPSLAIVFISIKQDRNAICEILREQGIDIVGATSCGEFINGHHDFASYPASSFLFLLQIHLVLLSYPLLVL